MGGQQLTQSSWFGADGHSRFQVLWQDGDRVFCRRVDGERDVLAVLLAAEHPAPAALDRLAHDSEEKHEPVSDIDTVVDSLKALDPEWPIREADIAQRGCPVSDATAYRLRIAGRSPSLSQCR